MFTIKLIIIKNLYYFKTYNNTYNTYFIYKTLFKINNKTMDVNNRMTYFDGKKILFDEYEDTYNDKFDQNFDDNSNIKNESKVMNKSLSKSIHYPVERSDIYGNLK